MNVFAPTAMQIAWNQWGRATAVRLTPPTIRVDTTQPFGVQVSSAGVGVISSFSAVPLYGTAKSEETASRTITFDSSVQEISFDLFLGTTKQTIPLTVALSKDRATIAEFSMSPDPMQTGVRIYLRRPLFEPSGGNFVLNVSQDGTLRDVPIRVRLR